MAMETVAPVTNKAYIVINLNESNCGDEGRIPTSALSERGPDRIDSRALIWSGIKLFLLISGLVAFSIMIVRTHSHVNTTSTIDEHPSSGAESLIEIGELKEQTEAIWLIDAVELPSTQPSWDRSIYPPLVQSRSPPGTPSDSPIYSIYDIPSVQPTETTASSNSKLTNSTGVELDRLEPSNTSTSSNSTVALSLAPTTVSTRMNASATPFRSMAPVPSAFAEALDTPSPSTNPSKGPTFFHTSVQPTVNASYEKSTVPTSMKSMLQSSSYEPTHAPNSLFPSGTNMLSLTPTPSSNNSLGENASEILFPTMPLTSSPSTFNTTEAPTLSKFLSRPTENPSQHSTRGLTSCFSYSVYASIDADIARLKLSITDNTARAHFLGGIVRLAAHDFMDFDRFSFDHYGPDGCFDPAHDANSGLPDDVWCETCLLRSLFEAKYTHLSRADFWIASANAVIRQTSINNTLDLREHFTWGRTDRDSCEGSGDRIPAPTKCSEVENAFLVRMGLDWRDAVALLGAHSLGRSSASFSGHEGLWVDNTDDAQVFDKQYYEELYLNAWRPRNAGGDEQDWTTGYDTEIINNTNPRLMLNTDLCLVYDIESVNNYCCTRTDYFYSNGENECLSTKLAKLSCPFYSRFDSRREAADAVAEFLGGAYPNSNNEPFYSGFTGAWVKATSLDNLLPLFDSCESQGVLFS